MRLDVVSGDSSITAVEDLDPLLEYGNLSVRLDAVSRVLEGIRLAALAHTPADSALREANPARQAQLAETILTVAAAAKRLAQAAPAGEPDAETILATLQQLHLGS